MRTLFLGLVFFMLLRTISGQDSTGTTGTTGPPKKDCTRADMEACPLKKEIFQDRTAMLAQDKQRVDVYERRDDHDGSHCRDCCLYSKVGEPETGKGRKMAYCMDEGDCDLCVDSCNTTCTCELPDKDCWEWQDCAGKAIEVGTACTAVCTENKTLTETFNCENANAGMPGIQSTVSSLPNSGAKNCDAVWMYKGSMVTVGDIVMIGEETCSGYCKPMIVEGPYSVQCQNWNNESLTWENVTADKVTSQGACIIECIPSKEITNTQWTYYCYPDNQTTTTTESKCQVFWHGDDTNIRTIEEIQNEINTNDCNGTTIVPPESTTTTTSSPPPPPNCIGDCSWPPYTDPRGTWDNSSCLLICDPVGKIGDLNATIPDLNANCTNPTAGGPNTQQWSYSTGEGNIVVEYPEKFTENQPYCPRPCKRPQTCPPSILQGKPDPCKYICTMTDNPAATPQEGEEIATQTKCQLQCYNETVMSGPMAMTTLPPNRRKRQATLPGDITTPIIEGISTPIIDITPGNGITTPITEGISTPIIDMTPGVITPDTTPGGTTNSIENPMAEVVCNNDTTLTGADGKPYEYNEQDPQWKELCDNTIVMVVSKMVYSENEIAGDFPLFDEKDAQQPAKPAWENLWCTNVMLDQWSRVSPKGLATGYDKEKDPETTSRFVRRPNLPNRKDPKPYDNETRMMPDDDQFYHLLQQDPYSNTSEQGEVEVGGFPPLNLALQAYSELTWKSEGLLNGENKTHGYYEGIYQRDGKDQINHYFTDNFYLTVGEGELDPLMKRKLVRKVNIWVPIFDDSCFDYCGQEDAQIFECRKKCKPLDKTALDALGVTVTIKCTSCEADTDELVKYYYNSSQTQLNIWHDNLKMYPHGEDDSVTWVESKEIGQPMYTAVGPPGLWEVQCSVDPLKGADYITTVGNPNVQPQKRWLRENTLIPCSLNLKLNKNGNSVINFDGFPEKITPHHKELIKFSMDWSLPNHRVAGTLGFGFVLFTGTGKGICMAKAPARDGVSNVPWMCYKPKGERNAKEGKDPEPKAVADSDTQASWNCASTHNHLAASALTFTKGATRDDMGIGYSLNSRCCIQVKNISQQCEVPEPNTTLFHEGNNMGVGPTTLIFTDKIFTDIGVEEDEQVQDVKHILIIAETNEFTLLQSQVGVSVQYLDQTGTEKLDRINIERGLLHSKTVQGGSHIMMCLKLNKAGQVIKMERPTNKWIHEGGDSNHLTMLQNVNRNSPLGGLATKIKCGQCFDLFCNWNTIEYQTNSKTAKYQCCMCAKYLEKQNNEEGWKKGDHKNETVFDKTAVVRCPWPGTFYNPDKDAIKDKSCTCETGPSQGASRSIKAQGPKDAREFEPQVLRLENDEEEDENDGGAPDQAKEGLEEEEEEEGGDAGGNASSKEYFEEAEDDSYLGANQDLLEEAEDNPL